MDTVTMDQERTLHTAALENDLDTLERLLKPQTNNKAVNSKDRQQRTPLHCLLSGQQFENLDNLQRGLEILQMHGADVNVQDHLLNTPIHLVFGTYNIKIPAVVELTLKLFPNYNWTLKNSDGHSLFHVFISDVQDNIKESDDAEQLLKGRDDFIKRFLHGKLHGVTDDIIKSLLNETEKSGYSAFQTYMDTSTYETDTLNLMIEKGANVNNQSKLGITPLMKAALRQRDDVVELLLSVGADPNLRDIFGQTVMFRVRTERSFRLLCDHGADIHVTDRVGISPTCNFVVYVPQNLPIGGLSLDDYWSEYSTLAELFFKRGSDARVTDKHGSTLLHFAAWFGDPDIVKYMLEQGVPLNVNDSNGLSPYDLAVLHGNYEILNLLQTDESEPVDPEYINAMEQTNQYCRLAIDEMELGDMNAYLDMVNIRNDPEKLVSLFLKVPHFGMVSRKPEASEVVQSVTNLMLKAAESLAKLDPRFRASIRPTGSSSEGTMIGDPAEFDFVFCLDYFSEECEVIQPENLNKTGFAKLVIKSENNNHSLKAFENSGGFICTSDVRHVFQDLMTHALNNPEIWEDEHLYFDGLLLYPDDKPILNIQVLWHGALYKHIYISVDMVPAIHKDNWFPSEVKKDTLNVFSEKVKESGFFILFHGPEFAGEKNEGSWNNDEYVRISSASMEIAFFQNSPEIYREIYSICKTLKHKYFCPMIQFDDESDYESESLDENEGVEEDIGGTDRPGGGRIDEARDDNNGKHKPKDLTKQSHIHLMFNSGQTLNTEPGVANKNVGELDNKQDRTPSDWLAIIDPNTRCLKSIYKRTPKRSKEKAASSKHTGTIDSVERAKGEEDSTVIYSRKGHLEGKTSIDIKKEESVQSQEMDILKESKLQKRRRTEEGASEYTILSEPGTTIEDTQEAVVHEESEVKQQNVKEHSAQHTVQYTVTHLDQSVKVIAKNRDVDISDESGDNEDHDSGEEFTVGTELEGGDVVEASDCITSYMLKNCLLHVLDEKRKDSVDFKPTYIDMARGIYGYLLRCADKRCLPAYCLPFIDIFSYVNEHIRGVEPDKKEVELELLCKRISCFCTVILGILNQGERDDKGQ